jgi:hypothetical protein
MEIKRKLRPYYNLKLMGQVFQVLVYQRYAYRTEQTYCNWTEQYIKFHKYKKHPREIGKIEIEAYPFILSHLYDSSNSQ